MEGLDKKVLDVAKNELPKNLASVHKMFNEVEKVVMMRFSLGQRITLELLKKNVAINSKKALTEDLMGKILAIYPKSYHIELKKDTTTKPGQPLRFDLFIKPNLKDDLSPYYNEDLVPKSPVKPRQLYTVPTGLVSPRKKPQNLDYIPKSPMKSPRKGQAVPLPREVKTSLGPKFEGWRKDCREVVMKYHLHQHLLEEHKKFLDKNECEGLKEGNFHPDFVVDTIDVPPLALPKPKLPKKQLTMMDYLSKVPATGILKSVEKVTEELKSPEKKLKVDKENEKTEVTDKTVKPKPTAKMSLLERIKQKAKEAEELEKKKDPVLLERISALESLKLNILSVICSEYNNRTSMDITELYKRVHFSLQTRKDKFEHIVTVLSEIAPSLIVITTLNKKICKNGKE
ncbi:unnamed protein product [Bursaphelenchus okinawaensis]|uniref:CDT1 Geminin-binding domain-containing protein n=1 Tax=Bursaphelenchus okinawaensis TaxID=465554 RepID=A0A811JT25_9BILA|nr:unnamed protein product [Bursaphelenchus okinawaensis]CAG9081212.1 unnamed protein product [Bursaphelenchus okinawaensis]